MPPRQEQRGRGRGKRPRDSPPDATRPAGFAPINNSPSASRPSLPNLPYESASASPTRDASTRAQAPPPPGKVAIPALKNPRLADSKSSLKKGRTAHACDFCRRAKAGCTGGDPCTRCRNANVPCVYGDGKRDKDKKRLTKLSKKTISLNQHALDVTEALRRIRLDTSLSMEDMRAAIDHVLTMAPAPVTPENDGDGEPARSRSRPSSDPGDDGISGNEDLDAEVGSTGSLDVINVNPDQDDTRATGYMGKSSSVAWTKRTVDECGPTADPRSPLGDEPSGFVSASYHTEDPDVEYFDTGSIRYFDWPEPELADALVQSYFDTIHRAFPIVEKVSFMARYNMFVRGSTDLQVEEILWLGTLNMIFAISAVYAHLTRSRSRGHYFDHRIYLARAKMLCLDQGLLYEDARVHTTSALGLLCLYFITTGGLNRAWAIGGLAIRHALTLGLHVRSEAETLSDFDKEYRVRLWWSLYSLECLLNELTGRPSCISDRDISTPLPVNIDEDDLRPGQSLYERPGDRPRSSRRGSHSSVSRESRPGRASATYQMPAGIAQPLAYNFPVLSLPATTSTYFIYRTQLAIISHEIVTQLYCAATIKEKWVEVQETIHRIDSRLSAWSDSLPPEFSLTFDRYDEPDWNDPHVLSRMGLAMLYNSSRMILFRPCLCRFEGRITSQSEKSKQFSQVSVEMCIRSARTMINLIGWSARSVEKLYAITPWWHTLHYICEALSVLMLELAYQAQHLPGEAAEILDDAKKGIRWLVMMAGESISARKAWEIFDSLIRLVAPKIHWSVYDLPTTAPIPPGYNWRRWQPHASHSQTAYQPQPPPSSPALPGTHYGPQHASQTPTQLQTQYPDPAQTSFPAPPWGPAAASFDLHLQMHQNPQHHQQQQQPLMVKGYQASNPLDQSTAVQMFGSIGSVHGHFDEPWQHMFQSGGAGMGPPPPAGSQARGSGGSGASGSGSGSVGRGGAFVGSSAAGGFFEGIGGFDGGDGGNSSGGGGGSGGNSG
ncbi:uncharacterized protein L3040_006283 [Drepanopeziza brunnea f. sp. 'multigermtubi']|uniref:uncharacterized protein n=1 Tax=Drepanopeziza brunnea f. sp. 'multigermtubi' TaxID=698441 RepID=UPI0023A16A97|nr:hypothetical protein L3040_006283 [Drepanopeziza brunnea f. sp. 'multigermtubi']